jgi:hypothetical protein
MFNTKYVIVDGSAIVFSSAITHRDMVGYNQKCDGAGFVYFYSDSETGEVKAKCSGESISLGIKSRGEEDSRIVNFQILNSY